MAGVGLDEDGEAVDGADGVGREDVGGRAGGVQGAGLEEEHVVGVLRGEVQVVQDGEDAHAVVVGEAAREAEDAVLVREVEAGGGLVEEEVARRAAGIGAVDRRRRWGGRRRGDWRWGGRRPRIRRRAA